MSANDIFGHYIIDGERKVERLFSLSGVQYHSRMVNYFKDTEIIDVLTHYLFAFSFISSSETLQILICKHTSKDRTVSRKF